MTTMMVAPDPTQERVGHEFQDSAVEGVEVQGDEVGVDRVGGPPVCGGWEALVEYARVLGPDPVHAGLDDVGLEVEVRRAAGAHAAATAQLLELVGEFVARDLWVSLGMVSPGQWLSWAIGMAPSTAREMVRVALALRTFSATAERFSRGELSYSKVRAITRCGEPELEALLLQYADNAPASQLERIVRTFRSLDDDVDPHDERMVAVRHGDRHVTLTVRLPPEVGLEAEALMDRIVDRLDHERQPTDGELPDADLVPADAAARLDPVSARRADAVVHGLRLAVDHLDADLSAAARTTLVLHGDVDATIDQLSDCSRAASASTTTGCACADAPAAVPVDAAPMAAGPAGVAGSPVTAVTQSGGLVRLPRCVLRALTCDVQLRRVVTAGGTPMDVGRTQRLATWRLREALRARDGTCRFPGCAATRHLHAHHVIHWADDGPTDLANLVLLCGAHHRFVHAKDWIVAAIPEGSGWTFRAPDATDHLPVALRAQPVTEGASAEAARGHDPWALQPTGWDGARLDLDAALDIMWQELDRLPSVPVSPRPRHTADRTHPAS